MWLDWAWIRARSEEDADERRRAAQRLIEREEVIAYHEAQQRMVDRYFQEIYRPQDTPPLRFHMNIRPVQIAQ
jgi:hypothetical protein